MSSRVENFYRFPIFQNMKGLPEEIVKFEAKTGESLPDTFDYAFVQALETDDMTMVLGRIGFFYTVIMEVNENVKYEMHENKFSFKLWAAELVSDIVENHKTMEMTEEENENLQENMRLFLEKVEKIIEED